MISLLMMRGVDVLIAITHAYPSVSLGEAKLKQEQQKRGSACHGWGNALLSNAKQSMAIYPDTKHSPPFHEYHALPSPQDDTKLLELPQGGREINTRRVCPRPVQTVH